jgi:predicted RNA-binding protein with RPS1 domain
MLQDDLREKDMQVNVLSSQFEHEKSLSIQKIDSLEANLRETKHNLSRMSELMNENLDTQKAGFANEKRELLEKVESLQVRI